MRIIGYIDHPQMKITIFKMDIRLSIKFELGHLEQTYKFRQEEGLEGFQEVRKMVDDDFLKRVEEQFKQMKHLHAKTIAKRSPEESDDEFDEII